MSELPHYLETQAAEYGNLADELLLALVKTIEKQNAILDDTVHGELKRMADAQERIAHHLEVIAHSSRYIGP